MLAVTTRNKLRSSRFSLSMLRARRYVREQLLATPGLIRYVSAIASPTEFLTMTVWENRQAMYNFMSSGAHQEFMWMFSTWSSSFWSMRWVPTRVEEGAWEGMPLSNLAEPDNESWRAALPKIPPVPMVEQRRGRMPGAHFADPSGSGVFAVTALVEAASPMHLWAVLRARRAFRDETQHSRLLRWNIGAAGPRSFWILTLWRNAPGAPAAGVCTLHRRLNASWTMCWAPGEYEIGHWNGLRLRQLASARSRELRMQERS